MKKKVEVEVSARHIHLSKNDFELLFGPEAEFKNIRELSQRNEFTTDKEVKIVGPDGHVNARFLSPFRERTQVELSATDCYEIGISAPYEVNVFDGAAQVTIRGSVGEISRSCAIIARRHLHCNPDEAKELRVVEDMEVSVSIQTGRGKILFENVVVKTEQNYNLRVHLDLDEGNAAGISDSCFGELILNQNDSNN